MIAGVYLWNVAGRATENSANQMEGLPTLALRKSPLALHFIDLLSHHYVSWLRLQRYQ